MLHALLRLSLALVRLRTDRFVGILHLLMPVPDHCTTSSTLSGASFAIDVASEVPN